ncbi:MAG: hypothetical protein IT431_11540 [Phycisphaerales bacterium]|nr:hypothetical protein [Phycisphaerales bacterium]
MSRATLLTLYRGEYLANDLAPVDDSAVSVIMRAAMRAVEFGFSCDPFLVRIPALAGLRGEAGWGVAWWTNPDSPSEMHLLSSVMLPAILRPVKQENPIHPLAARPPERFVQLETRLVVDAERYTFFIDGFGQDYASVLDMYENPLGCPPQYWARAHSLRLPENPTERECLILTGKPKPPKEEPF